ncbi:MAG: hypothetical protein HY392_04345 [Candidatus Diapherotrites archaeon]|nr:hypothetical protein [Candidatus Diapherotrites archaeon]
MADFSGFSDYFSNTLVKGVLAGEPTSIVIVGVLVLILLAVFFKLSQLVYALVKRFFLFLVVLLSLYFFAVNFQDKIFSESPDMFILAVGILGLLIGLVAFVISVFSFHSSYSSFKARSGEDSDTEITLPKKKSVVVEPSAPVVKPTQIQQPDFFSQQFLSRQAFSESMASDRSLLAVLSYAIIAQFGVFSGVTVSAPSFEVGLAFFIAFFIGAFIFIKTSYHSYARGITHLVLASVFGFGLSIVLGHYWGTIPFEVLLSTGYFTSHALVAFVTGIAVSLLMGSKH